MRRTARELETPQSVIVSVETGAAVTGIAVTTLRRWIREGRIEHVRLGRRVLIRRDALDRFITKHEVPASL